MRSGIRRRTAAVGTALLGLTAIIALASRAHGPGGGSTQTVSTDWLLEYLLLLIVLALVVVLAAGIYLLVAAPEGAVWTPPPRASFWRTILTLAVFLAVVFALISLLHRSDVRLKPQKPSGSPVAGKPQTVGGTPAHFDWVPAAVVGGLTVVGLVAGGWIVLRNRAPKRTLEHDAAAALLVALDESLDDLRAEPDARRAVIAAYARMDGALANAGLGRRTAEAPREYLARALPAVGAGAGSVQRLTALFEEAKFSPHDVDGGMKSEAIEALAALREDLRAAE